MSWPEAFFWSIVVVVFSPLAYMLMVGLAIGVVRVYEKLARWGKGVGKNRANRANRRLGGSKPKKPDKRPTVSGTPHPPMSPNPNPKPERPGARPQPQTK